MAKITAPAKGYSGTSASVKFEKGVGYTDNPRLISWFKRKGYEVEEEAAKETEPEIIPDGKIEPAGKGKKGAK